VFEWRAHEVPLLTGAGVAAATGVEVALVVERDEATPGECTTRRMTTVFTTRRVGVICVAAATALGRRAGSAPRVMLHERAAASPRLASTAISAIFPTLVVMLGLAAFAAASAGSTR